MAEMIISLMIGGIALGLMFRAMSPFGQLVIGRSDILSSIAYGLCGCALLGLSGWIWMLGAD